MPWTALDSPGLLGAHYLGDGRCRFCVWAPLAGKVEAHLLSPHDCCVPLEAGPRGYHEAIVDNIAPGALYLFRLDGDKERPDPASRLQPQGVHGPSQVVDPRFEWHDAGWFGVPLPAYVVYELHVGTFTPQGTFDGVIAQLDMLKELGVTAVELMPVAQFPGTRNWGYDGVYLFAVQDSYGGPDGLKRLVDACHRKGLSVILDVVYNHLGPEGNYLWDYAPYFTDRYRTPWGAAVNFDGAHSDEVRRFFLENALQWQTEFHIDALRLDAVHAIRDFSAEPFLYELAVVARRQSERLNRRFHLIAESDLNDSRLIRPPEQGGFGLDAQWSDDFHHAAHALLTGEQSGYYVDFGQIEHLTRVYRDGYTYAGDYSKHRKRRHGNPARDRPARQFLVCSQNHDQVGNRMLGERLTGLVPFEALKAAAGLVLLSPYVPLLFMGEEYGEPAPFQYFTSHGDADLIEAVRKGRREEFASFQWQGEVPDPQDEATFARSRPNLDLRHDGKHRVLWQLYQELIRLRSALPALANLSKDHQELVGYEPHKVIFVRRWTAGDEVFMIFNMSSDMVSLTFPVPAGRWEKVLDTAEPRWQGAGSVLPDKLQSTGEAALTVAARSAVLYRCL